MNTLLEVLEEILRYQSGTTILFDRRGVSWTIEELVDAARRGQLKPKSVAKKKQFFGGTTAEGRVSIVRQIPGTGPVTVLLENKRPPAGIPRGGLVIGAGSRRTK